MQHNVFHACSSFNSTFRQIHHRLLLCIRSNFHLNAHPQNQIIYQTRNRSFGNACIQKRFIRSFERRSSVFRVSYFGHISFPKFQYMQGNWMSWRDRVTKTHQDWVKWTREINCRCYDMPALIRLKRVIHATSLCRKYLWIPFKRFAKANIILNIGISMKQTKYVLCIVHRRTEGQKGRRISLGSRI